LSRKSKTRTVNRVVVLQAHVAIIELLRGT
jgi:hypothetical protein